jgi:hypothetical protein
MSYRFAFDFIDIDDYHLTSDSSPLLSSILHVTFSETSSTPSIETEQSRATAEKASRGVSEDAKAPIGFVEVRHGTSSFTLVAVVLLFFLHSAQRICHLHSLVHRSVVILCFFSFFVQSCSARSIDCVIAIE